MFIVTVLPLMRGGFVDELSYYSKETYPIGAILSVPIRNSTVQAVVISTKDVQDKRSEIRSATYALKRLPSQKDAIDGLTTPFIKTVGALAREYTFSRSGILSALLPTHIRDGDVALPHTPNYESEVPGKVSVLQDNYSGRIHAYKTIIREAFAHGGSTLVLAPTHETALQLVAELSAGIEDRTIVMPGMGKTKKHIESFFAALSDFSATKLIISSPGFALVERHDITTVIIEQERSPYWIMRQRPYMDLRDAVIMHAEKTGRHVVLGDILPRTETEYLRREDIYHTTSETPKRILLPGTLNVVRLTETPKEQSSFRLFSPKVIKSIREKSDQGGKVFLFAARRGIAPFVTCRDCGHIFRSPDSGTPYSLVRITQKDGSESRYFQDSTTGKRVLAAYHCPSCESWRLTERGVGIQSAYDELSAVLKKPIIIFDHTTANTHKKAMYLRDTFARTPGAIMIGTSMAIPHIGYDVDMSVIVNSDALRATPVWTVHEDIMGHILDIRERTKGKVFIQTRLKQDEATDDQDIMFGLSAKGSVEFFYDNEIATRQEFSYPPFSRFILLTFMGDATYRTETEGHLQKLLSAWNPIWYYGVHNGTDIRARNCLLRLPAKPLDETLSKILTHLPKDIAITHNPKRII